MDKRPIKILLVEDNAGDARLLREMINEPAPRKHDLVHHASIEQAINYLVNNPVDVVLLDLGLPDAQGLEAVRRIDRAAPHVPLVVLTGFDDETLAGQALQEGAQDYLVKGQIEPRGLLRAMRYAIERKRSELALIRERDIAQRYLDVAGVMILVLNSDATVRLINRHGCRILGYADPGDIVGKPWIDVCIPGRLRDEIRRAHSEFVGPERVTIEFHTSPVVTRTGEERVIAWHNSILTDEEGRLTGSLHSGDDITERLRIEENLRSSEERFRSIFSAVSEGIFIVDAATGAFAEVNEPGAVMYGYAPEEMIGLNIQSISSNVRPYTQSDAMGWIEKAAITGRRQQFDWHCKAKDGRLFWGEVSLRFAFISGRQVVLSIVRDVTDRRAIEEQLRQVQKMDAIGQLTGGMAHDFNNLLTVILSNAETLAEELDGNADLRALAEMTRTAAERGAELTNSLLTFARRQALDPQNININKLMVGMDSLLRRTLGGEIEIELVHGKSLWQASVDPVQLESALLNLALNARDAMPNGGKLTIETTNADIDFGDSEANDEVTPGRYVLLCVSDTGTGMSAEVAARAFDPFFSTKGVGKGTGLGLSMVYGFVKQSGGHIRIYSEVGLGTSFKVYLPRSAGAESPAEIPRARESTPIGTETILAVEDDDLVRAHTERVLRALGYNLLIASNGPEAMTILERGEHIDLLFTDVVMPGGMGGQQLADKACALRPALKVLFTSGYTDNALVHHGRLDPGVHLIRKPYRKKDLALKLRQLLDANPGLESPNASLTSVA
jgi:PAS domain S-box-containing protein